MTKLWWRKINKHSFSVFGQFFSILNQENLGFECKFNQISYVLVKFCQNFDTKKWKKNSGKLSFASKKYCFKWISIDFIPLFNVYDLLLDNFVYHCTKMRPSSLWVSLDSEWIWTFLLGEIDQHLNEWGPIVTNNELYLVKQGYFQKKYKFIKPFIC
jgi:hypothetical protein